MKITTVMFDLDGTSLPMDQDVFIREYFGLLAKKLVPYGYDPDKLIAAIGRGTKAMVTNRGIDTNETVFWKAFDGCFGYPASKDAQVHMDFYRNEFNQVKEVCGFAPMAAQTVRSLKKRGFRVILATNPLFPSVATENRIHWAGLEPEDFDYFTTYENARYCKPNPDYYWEILSKFRLTPRECVMIGNDAHEDMIAKQLGMQVFLLTDCLINKENADISQYPHGGFDDLASFLNDI